MIFKGEKQVFKREKSYYPLLQNNLDTLLLHSLAFCFIRVLWMFIVEVSKLLLYKDEWGNAK